MKGIDFSTGRKHGRYVEPRPDLFEHWLAVSLEGAGRLPGRREREWFACDCRITKETASRIFAKLFREEYGREPVARQL